MGEKRSIRSRGFDLTPFDLTRLQPDATALVQRAVARNRLGSTYLVYGEPGTGHWPFSLWLAALVNDATAGEDGLPAPNVESPRIRQILNANSELVMPIVPIAKHTSLDEAGELMVAELERRRAEPWALPDSSESVSVSIAMAREVKRRLAMTGDAETTRVAIFDQLELMRLQSADALLKLIEEPPPRTLIVLLTHNVDALLPTIRSRAQRIRLRPIPSVRVTEYLEARGIDATEARLAARLAGGSIGRALRFATESDKLQERIDAFQVYRAIMSDSAPAAVAAVEAHVDSKDVGAAARYLQYWQTYLHDQLQLSVGGDEEITNVDLVDHLRPFASVTYPAESLAEFAGLVKNCLADLRLNVHIHGSLTRLALEAHRVLHQAPGREI